jgi:hypothetical protein
MSRLQGPIFLTTDANNEGIRAVLCKGRTGKNLPIAYASRTLNKAEKTIPLYERNYLLLCWDATILDSTYVGEYVLVTYYRPVMWLFKGPDFESLTWGLKLEELAMTTKSLALKQNSQCRYYP